MTLLLRPPCYLVQYFWSQKWSDYQGFTVLECLSFNYMLFFCFLPSMMFPVDLIKQQVIVLKMISIIWWVLFFPVNTFDQVYVLLEYFVFWVCSATLIKDVALCFIRIFFEHWCLFPSFVQWAKPILCAWHVSEQAYIYVNYLGVCISAICLS